MVKQPGHPLFAVRSIPQAEHVLQSGAQSDSSTISLRTRFPAPSKCARKSLLANCEQRRYRRTPNQFQSAFVWLRIKSVEGASMTPRYRSPSATSGRSPNNRDTHYLPFAQEQPGHPLFDFRFGRFRKRNTPINDAGGRIPARLVCVTASLPRRIALRRPHCATRVPVAISTGGYIDCRKRASRAVGNGAAPLRSLDRRWLTDAAVTAFLQSAASPRITVSRASITLRGKPNASVSVSSATRSRLKTRPSAATRRSSVS